MVRKKLPPELGLGVINALGDEHDLKAEGISSAQRALSSCALVCKDWLRPSRRHLFRVIHVKNRKGLDSLRAAFAHHPELQACVSALHIYSGNSLVNVAIISLVPPLPSVHVLGLYSNSSRNELHLTQHALTALKVSPKLTTLCTNYVGRMHEETFLRLVASLPLLSELDCTSTHRKAPTRDHSHHDQVRQTYANILSRRRSVRSMTFGDHENEDLLCQISHCFKISLERITITDYQAMKFKFSDFPYLKDVVLHALSLFYATKYRLAPLLANNLDPGTSLRTITIITVINCDFFEQDKKNYAKKIQKLILSEPYKSVQLEFRIMHIKHNLVAETEKYVRQEFSRLLGKKTEPRVQLSITGSGYGHIHQPDHVVASPNGTFVASVSTQYGFIPMIVLWNACTGEILHQWLYTRQDPGLGNTYPICIAFSPDSTLILLFDCLLDELLIRSTNTGDVLHTVISICGSRAPLHHDVHMYHHAIFWEAFTVTIYDPSRNGIHVYHIHDDSRPVRHGFFLHPYPGYHSLTLSKSGRWLCVIDGDCSTGYIVDTLSLDIHMNLRSILQPLDESTSTYGKFLVTAFGETEDTLITVTASSRVLRWCIPSKRLLDKVDIRGLDGKRHVLSLVWLSRDGNRIAWVVQVNRYSSERMVLCDRLTGGEFAVFRNFGPRWDTISVSFSPDGEYVVVLSGVLHVYRTRDGTCVFADRTDMDKSEISWGGILPEQRVLAYGISDGTVGIVRMRDVDSDD